MENQPQPSLSNSHPAGYGLAIASMVLGIVAALTGLVVIGSALGIIAIVFGIIALKKRTGKAMAITGIITGSIGIITTLLFAAFYFFAVPSLQENSRDTNRENQVSLAVSDIAQYQSENQGALPDPIELSQSYETLSLKFKTSGEPTTDTAVYEIGKNCDGTTSSRAFNVSVKLENGKTYCQDS